MTEIRTLAKHSNPARLSQTCLKCGTPLGNSGMTPDAISQAWKRHLAESHPVSAPKLHSDKVNLKGAGSHKRDNQPNQKATAKPRGETRRAEVRGSAPRIELNLLPDSEWDASTQGN